MDVFELIELDKNDIIRLIKQYDEYVSDYPENHPDGGYPVCFSEWYDNDYKELEGE